MRAGARRGNCFHDGFYQVSAPSKNLIEVKEDTLQCSALACQASHDTVQSCWFGQAWLPLDEAMLIQPYVPGSGF